MLRNIACTCFSLLLGFSPLLNSQLRSEELINWHKDLASARQISQQYKVPMLIHFYGDQCMPCQTLEKQVFTRPEVASTMQRYFVPVRINATTDRRTAAEFGVHSWPTDVFVAPDGKTLTQGVCNQNPNNYLQNLQNVALMNRDRNAMLAGAAQPGTPTGGSLANQANAQQSNTQQTYPQQGNTQFASQAVGNGPNPYGRTATNNLQQSAPGRDLAPAPYSNPSSGASPYAQNAPLSGLPAASLAGNGTSTLPSPTWQGQTAGGQAQTGLVHGGPIPNATSMTLGPPQSAINVDNKLTNLPPTAQWQTGGPVSSSPFSQSTPTLAGTPALPLAPSNMPSMTNSNTARPNMTDNRYAAQAAPVTAGMVNNPHYENSNARAAIPGRLTSSSNNVQRSDSPLPPVSSSIDTAPSSDSRPAVVLPALGGYCPVALFGEPSGWVKGQEQFAVRHRGKVYLLSSEEAADTFLASPDHYTPVLSGHDPLVYIREGRLVEGSIYDGVLRDRQHIMLFNSAENKAFFYDNYDRLVAELEALIKQQAK